ncbi:MAG: hypothetical protein DWI57_08220 [Chloroflexi bacterium]|nr:MAG: hypothetical protein DWI57_08220 [Chloroflexota bacterium]
MLLLHIPSDPRSRYSRYLGEILRLEGFADWAEADIAALDAPLLAAHDLVILPRTALSQAQMDLLLDFVRQGGRLLALLPDSHLAAQLGLRPLYRGLDGGYLRIETAHPTVAGLAAQPVQIIGPSVNWAIDPNAAVETLAHIHADLSAEDANPVPGVVWSPIGKGYAAAFAYDLPHTVARLRQGNPEHVDLCFAGLDGIYRPSELFVGQLPVAQMYIPQADIHTALLARTIEQLAPRPRIWYYPHAQQQSALIMTSDDDWSTLEQFETLLAGLRQRQAHCTFYVVPKTQLDRGLMDRWGADGHTFSVHPALEADTVSGVKMGEPQSRLVVPMLAENVERHQRQFGRTPRTVRQHAVRWLGYVDAARTLADLGVGMDLNYVAVSPYLGHLCGSGRPLRFVDSDGTLIDCFQQPTHWTEECLIHPEFVFSFKWTVEKALAETGALIREAARRYYTPIALNSHPVSFATYSSPLIEGNWDAALAEQMPILSADEWLAWTEARDGARLIASAAGWEVRVKAAMGAITLLIPAQFAVRADDGTLGREERWGREYTTVTFHGLTSSDQRRIRYE